MQKKKVFLVPTEKKIVESSFIQNLTSPKKFTDERYEQFLITRRVKVEKNGKTEVTEMIQKQRYGLVDLVMAS